MKVREDFLGPPRSTDKTTLIMEGDCTHNPEDWSNKLASTILSYQGLRLSNLTLGLTALIFSD